MGRERGVFFKKGKEGRVKKFGESLSYLGAKWRIQRSDAAPRLISRFNSLLRSFVLIRKPVQFDSGSDLMFGLGRRLSLDILVEYIY